MQWPDPWRSALGFLYADAQIALAIAIRKRELFLKRTNEPPIGLDMRMLKTPVSGEFIDLRGLPQAANASERHKAAAALPEGATGVVFRAPERPFSDCVAITDKNALGKLTQTAHYRFQWEGERIASIYVFREDKPEIDPDDLFGQKEVLAA